jgi:hypothetical protein
LDRAARWDGVVPTTTAGLDVTPGDLRWLDSYLRGKRDTEGDFDIIRYGQTQGPDDVAAVRESAEAGATWWCEYIYTANTTLDDTRARIRRGPPRT